MPIISIPTQPATNALQAAYRPILLTVRATRTDGQARPPVVYCDVYINGAYYKTISKTQYTKLNSTNSDWQFDLQDACQEYLKKEIGTNGGIDVISTSFVMASVYVKFRSSGFDINGFVTSENLAPVQGSGSTIPVAGTGTQSRTFYVVNSALQQQDSQDLATHLSKYKKGTWAANAYPLSHRQDNYRIGKTSSDYFPIIYLGTKALRTRLCYRTRNQTAFTCVGGVVAPAPSGCTIVVTALSVTDGTQTGGNHVYNALWQVNVPPASFKAEYSTNNGTTWFNANILTTDNNSIEYNIGLFPSTTHLLRITPYCNATDAGTSATATYTATAATCAPVGIVDGVKTPNGIVGQAYNYSFLFLGDVPFVISAIVKPAWMTVSLNGSVIQLTGMPTAAGTNLPVSFTLTNCGGTNSVNFSDVLTIVAAPSMTETSNTTTATTRTQVFNIGSAVMAGNKFYVGVYSYQVTVTAVAADTPDTIAQKLRDAVNATTLVQWNSAGANFTNYKPSATSVLSTSTTPAKLSLTLNVGNQFAAGATIN